MKAVILNEDEIGALTEAISEACDGQNAVVILVAISDMLMAIAEAHPGMPVTAVIADLVNLTEQRHGSNGNQTVN